MSHPHTPKQLNSTAIQSIKRNDVKKIAKVDNFAEFQIYMNNHGFHHQKAFDFNGFLTYLKRNENPPNIIISMRSCDGECCKGIIKVQPIPEDQLLKYMDIVYAPLQNTLNPIAGSITHSNISVSTQVKSILNQIVTNLRQSNMTSFSSGNLNVKGECLPLSAKDYKEGKRPYLTITLSIPHSMMQQ